MLESMLKDRGADPPPVVYPPKTTRGSLHVEGDQSPVRVQTQQPASAARERTIPENTSPESIGDEMQEPSHPDSIGDSVELRRNSAHEIAQGTPFDDKNEGLVNRLLSTRGHLSFDQLSGRLRYFGPTTNCWIYSELDPNDAKNGRESIEQARRAEKVIRTLPIELHDYLMQLFWQHYNGVLHVVHEEAFNEDRENGRTQFYSGFLHICILAMGYVVRVANIMPLM